MSGYRTIPTNDSALLGANVWIEISGVAASKANALQLRTSNASMTSARIIVSRIGIIIALKKSSSYEGRSNITVEFRAQAVTQPRRTKLVAKGAIPRSTATKVLGGSQSQYLCDATIHFP